MKRRHLASLALGLACTSFAAIAQNAYPNKPVKFVVPYAAGGLPDSVARIVAQKLTERLGQPFVIDNKPGGNGMVAYQTLMNSANDGYTFIVSDGSMLSITPQVNKNAQYAVGKDLAAVSLIARSPLFLVAHPKSGVKNLQDFISKVKEKPGFYTYGSSGIGSTHHLTMEALKAEMKLDVRHIPFRGSGQSVPALVGGQVDFLFSALPSMLGFVKSNQVTLIASNDAKRSNQAPDVPAIAEVVPKFDFSVAVGVLARSGTPQDIIKKLSDEIAQAVKSPDVVEKFTTAGIEAIGASPDAYAKTIEQENTAMAKAGKAADLKAE